MTAFLVCVSAYTFWHALRGDMYPREFSHSLYARALWATYLLLAA
jgi:hypothetical protein